jgi:hypothetical protein
VGKSSKRRANTPVNQRPSKEPLLTHQTINDKLSKKSSSRHRLTDQIKIAELEKKIFATAFKHKVWNRIFSKKKE